MINFLIFNFLVIIDFEVKFNFYLYKKKKMSSTKLTNQNK